VKKLALRKRRPPSSIAKVNATSLDGYFGSGTPCFLIRGTILSDVLVEGEYRTLDLYRPGNVIEVEDFDGDAATISITTRPGSRDGDNVYAHMVVRDADLRAVGIDCERILSGAGILIAPLEPSALGAPFARTIDSPPEPAGNGNGARAHGFAMDDIAPLPIFVRDMPPPVMQDVPSPVEEAAPPPPPETPAQPARRDREPLSDFTLTFGNLTIEGRLVVEIGGALISLALPVLLYVFGRIFRKPPPPND
jgi:hypothetical protein